jgi:hypothetical protein
LACELGAFVAFGIGFVVEDGEAGAGEMVGFETRDEDRGSLEGVVPDGGPSRGVERAVRGQPQGVSRFLAVSEVVDEDVAAQTAAMQEGQAGEERVDGAGPLELLRAQPDAESSIAVVGLEGAQPAGLPVDAA